MSFEGIRERKDCYLGGEGGGARGDGGRTAGRWQAYTVVNGICGFPLLGCWYCTLILLLLGCDTTLILCLLWIRITVWWLCFSSLRWNCTSVFLLLAWMWYCIWSFLSSSSNEVTVLGFIGTDIALPLGVTDTALGFVETILYFDFIGLNNFWKANDVVDTEV